MTSREYGRDDIGRKPGMPRVDKSTIGYKTLNMKDDPDAFKSEEELARDIRENKLFWEAVARQGLGRAVEKAAVAAVGGVVPDDGDAESDAEDEPVPSEADNDESGDYMPGGGKAKVSSKGKGKGKSKAKAKAVVPMVSALAHVRAVMSFRKQSSPAGAAILSRVVYCLSVLTLCNIQTLTHSRAWMMVRGRARWSKTTNSRTKRDMLWRTASL